MTITPLNSAPISFDGSNYVLSAINGLESPIVRLPRYNLPGNSGAYISNALYGERSLKIKGYVNAPDGKRTTYLANRTNLINALSFQYDNSGNIAPQTVTITLENGQVLTTSAYIDTPLQMGFSEDQMDFEQFQFTMVAADPNLYSNTATTAVISPPVGGGTAIPTVIPISLAASSGGSAVMTNTGSATAFPTITLAAPLTNPYLTNLRTGAFLKINYTLAVGDASLIINCLTQQITQGVNNKNGIQSQDSTFWGLLSGANTIGFSASAGTGTATVAFFPVFIGV